MFNGGLLRTVIVVFSPRLPSIESIDCLPFKGCPVADRERMIRFICSTVSPSFPTEFCRDHMRNLYSSFIHLFNGGNTRADC